jgi:hypothetical protein
MAARQWTAAQRAERAVLIRSTQPWLRSTGPRTLAGKARSRTNAFKGAERPLARVLARELNEVLARQLALLGEVHAAMSA